MVINMEVIIKKYEPYFHIIVQLPYTVIMWDQAIAELLNLSLIDYQRYMVKNFKTVIVGSEICFKSEKQIKQAIEWIESILIANILKENK